MTFVYSSEGHAPTNLDAVIMNPSDSSPATKRALTAPP